MLLEIGFRRFEHDVKSSNEEIRAILYYDEKHMYVLVLSP
jgi:hypothetical protein